MKLNSAWRYLGLCAQGSLTLMRQLKRQVTGRKDQTNDVKMTRLASDIVQKLRVRGPVQFP